MNESFEIEIAGKTYVTKKMTPILRAKLLKVLPLAKFSELHLQEKNLTLTFDAIADTLEFVPPLMWEFIKDEDKKILGTYQSFLESLDENINSIMKFIEWGMLKVQELSDFLAPKVGVAKV